MNFKPLASAFGMLTLLLAWPLTVTAQESSFELVVNCRPGSAGMVTARSDAIDTTGTSVDMMVAAGTMVTMTATASPHWFFMNWSGDTDNSTADSIQVTMDGNKVITAAFTSELDTLRISTVGQGVITPPDPQIIAYGDSIQLTAVPNPGWHFTSWNGTAAGTTNPVYITMYGNTTVIGTFEHTLYTITIHPAEHGTVSPVGTFTRYDGDTVAISFTPDSCYRLSQVLDNGVESFYGPDYVFVVDEQSHDIQPVFAQQVFQVSTATSGYGKGLIAPDNPVVLCGATQIMTFTPDSCSHLTDVMIDDISLGPITSYQFSNAHLAHNIIVTFEPNQYVVTVHGDSAVQIFLIDSTYTCQTGTIRVDWGNQPCWKITGVAVDGDTLPASVWETTFELNLPTTRNHHVEISAGWDFSRYPLTTSYNGDGIVTKSVPDSSDYQHCTEITLTATPDLGWYFVGWTGDVSTPINPLPVPIAGPTSYTANFAKIPGAQLSVVPLGPSATPTPRELEYDFAVFNGGAMANNIPIIISGIPDSSTIRFDFTPSSPLHDDGEPDWTQISPIVRAGTASFASFILPQVPTGTTLLQMFVRIPTNQPQQFTMRVALFRTWGGDDLTACLQNEGMFPDSACLNQRLVAMYGSWPDSIIPANAVSCWAKLAWQCAGATDIAAALQKAQAVLNPLVQFMAGDPPPTFCPMLEPTWLDSLRVNIDPHQDLNQLSGPPQNQGVSTQGELSYAIDCENATNAPGPALSVFIADTLDVVALDPSSLRLGPIRFGTRQLVPPPGVSNFIDSVEVSSSLRVRVQAWLANGVMNWQLDSVDPSTGQPNTTMGVLPLNLNSPEGQGRVQFSIRPRVGLPSGLQIHNQAAITLTYPATTQTTTRPGPSLERTNAGGRVVTKNTSWVNQVDNSPPSSSVQSLPEVEPDSSFMVYWSSPDPDVHDFTLYVSENNGPSTIWLGNTTADSARFIGAWSKFGAPRQYAFWSIARDQVGNLEPPTDQPKAQMIIQNNPLAVGPTSIRPVFALEGAVPNPTTNSLSIAFTLVNQAPASLVLYDLAGRIVLRQEVGPLGPGRHLVHLNAVRPVIFPGIYFVRLDTNGRHLQNKVVVLQ